MINSVAVENVFKGVATMFNPIGSPATILRRVRAHMVGFTMTKTDEEQLRQYCETRINKAAASEPAHLLAWQLAINPFLEYQVRFSGVVRHLQQIEADVGMYFLISVSC
jgi:hypothetical protein